MCGQFDGWHYPDPIRMGAKTAYRKAYEAWLSGHGFES